MSEPHETDKNVLKFSKNWVLKFHFLLLGALLAFCCRKFQFCQNYSFCLCLAVSLCLYATHANTLFGIMLMPIIYQILHTKSVCVSS